MSEEAVRRRAGARPELQHRAADRSAAVNLSSSCVVPVPAVCAVTSLISNLRRAVSPAAGVRSSSDQQLELRIAGRSLSLQPGLTYLVGSSETAHIQLSGPGIEPEHLSLRDGVLRVNQSRSSTRLNGREVLSAHSPQLRDGDVIGLGTHSISVHTSHTPRAESQHTIVGASHAQQPHSLPDKVVESQPRKESGNGMVYGQSFNDKELDRLSPPAMQQQQHQPIMQQQQTQQMQQPQPLQQHTQLTQQRNSSDEHRHILTSQTEPEQQHQPHAQLVAPGQTGTMSNGLQVQAGARPVLMCEAAKEPHAFQGHGATGPTVARLKYHHTKPQQRQGAGAGASMPVATLVNKTDAPAAAKVTMINQQHPDQREQTNEPEHQSSLSSGQNRFQQMHLNSAGAQSEQLGTSHLAPVFTNSELTSILVDMLELQGSSMNDASRALVPHWLSLFPASSRQNMSSKQMKVWIRKALEERDARLGGGSSSAAGPSATSAAAPLSTSATSNTKEVIESDMALALLAMQAESQRNTPADSSTHIARNPLSDYNLLSLLSDYAEMGGWTLHGNWESAARAMLDDRHTAKSRRDTMGPLDIRTWLQAAADDKLHGTQQGGSKTITELQLIHGLVASNQHPI